MDVSENQPSVKYYVINLRSAEERRQSMLEQAEHFGLHLHIVEAISGADMPPEEARRYDSQKAGRYSDERLIPNEIACILSHRKALSQFLDDGADFGVILEDDALLQPHFAAAIDELVNRVRGWDAVKLEMRTPCKFFPLCSTWLTDSVLQPVFAKNLSCGTAGFLYTRKAAEILLHDTESFFLPADAQFAEIFLQQRLLVITPLPPPIMTCESINPSTIHPEDAHDAPPSPGRTFSSTLQHLRHSCRRRVISLRKISLYLKLLRTIRHT